MKNAVKKITIEDMEKILIKNIELSLKELKKIEDQKIKAVQKWLRDEYGK